MKSIIFAGGLLKGKTLINYSLKADQGNFPILKYE